MARMLPDLSDVQLSELRSRAEARFYECCRAQLPAEIVCLHSTGWIFRDSSGRLREGEADFTLLIPTFGVLVVEVKGGGVTYDPKTDSWTSLSREGQRHAIKDPFKQASSERHALIDQISADATWRQWKKGPLGFGHAVAFPDIKDAGSLVGPNRPRELVGTSKQLEDLNGWVNHLTTFWRRELDVAPGPKGIRIIQDILSRSVEVKPVLSASISQVELQRIRLTANQTRVLRVIGNRRRAVVSGGAGTGKTLIAVEKARQLASQGHAVVLLCYNRPLADALSKSLKDEERISVLSFHQLCEVRIREAAAASGRQLLKEAMSAYPGIGDRHMFDVQYPYALALSNEVLPSLCDALIVDEAQDFSDEYWFAVEELLHEPEVGHIYIFIDENQALYKRHGNLPVSEEPFYLTTNCRNTSAIHQAAYQFYKGEAVDGPELVGPDVERIAKDTAAAQAEYIIRRIHHLISEEGLRATDVAVLIAKRPKGALYELLRQARLEVPGTPRLVFEEHERSNAVLVDTVARFKGLESPAVVLWLGDEVVAERSWETVYVGMSRAKSLLIVVGSRLAVSCNP